MKRCPFCQRPITSDESITFGCCTSCAECYDRYQDSPSDIPDDGRYHRDEYEPWETPEWFTDGPGSMNDPRHFQGIHAVRLG